MGGTGIGGALNVGTGLTVNSGGATVTAGGITVTNGGITVNGGDVTLNNTSGLTVAGTTTFNGNVRVAGAFSEFVAQNLVVTGSLFVQGNTTTVNATSVSTQDLLYVAASGAQTAGTAVGGGIATPYSALTFSNAPTNSWVSNVNIRPSANATSSLGDAANNYYWKQVAAETGYFGALTVNGSAVLTNASLAGQGVTSVAGTSNQIAVSGSYTVAGGGAVTLSLPQSINSGAAPTFAGTNFTSIPNGALTNSSLTVAAGTGISVSPTGGAVSLGGTVTVTNAGVVTLTGDATNGLTASASTGAVTLTLAQAITTTAAPTFKGTNFTVIPNGALVNSGIIHSAGTGMTVSPTSGTATALGGTVTYTNDGVVTIAQGTGMAVTGGGTGPYKGAVTVTNDGVLTIAVNGGTAAKGAVALSMVTSWNGSTGAVTYTAPVTSVNGSTGAVTLTIPTNTNQLTNGAGFVTAVTAPVTSVGSYTGAVTNAQVAASAQSGASGTWNISISGNANTAYYADLAEKYLPDAEYAPGTVVIFGGVNEITQSTMANDRRVAGVISTMPAWGMNEKLEGGIFVALTGRVPTKVIGTIEKGDLIVSSNTPGVAMANNDPKMGTIIGKALEAYNSGEVGEIEVVIGRF